MIRILTIFGILLFCHTNQTATACTCSGKSTVEKSYNSADIVAMGQVISTETEWFPDSTRINKMVKLGYPADSLDKRLNGFYFTKVRLLLDTVYKGQTSSDTLIIYTGMSGADCGFRFKKGNRYIIYGDTDSYLKDFFKDQEFPNGLDLCWTNICTRTQEYNLNEIKEFEKINK